MNPILEHLPPATEDSFFASAFDLPYFGTPWHYHPEYELVLIEESQGKRFIGNAISNFKPGDLSLLGTKLPHLYKNPPEYYKSNASLRARSVIIHFKEASLGGSGFLNLGPSQKIKKLLEQSRRGMDITGPSRKWVAEKMKALLHLSGLKKHIALLEILDHLADTTHFELISAAGIVGNNGLESRRLDKVFQYVMQNFNQPVTLAEVADLVHMTRTSFCRFFLERTKRNFSSFLIDIRLNHASRLLTSSDMTVIEIAYESGYNNLSNFHRQFKEKFALSPREYRKLCMASQS